MPAPEDVNVDDLKRRARRRLVGAIVLALAAAVFVPMLLESEPKPLGEDVSVKIPPVDDAKFVNRLNEKGKADAPKAAPPKVEARPAEARADEKTETAKVETAAPPKSDSEAPKTDLARNDATKGEAIAEAPKLEAPKSEPRPEPARPDAAKADAGKADAATEPKRAATESGAKAPAAAAAPAAHDVGNGFSVQLAAFSDNYGANALSNKLKKLGYPAYTEPLTTTRGTLYRVRVGPYPTREAAGLSRDKLKGEGYAGIVAPSK